MIFYHKMNISSFIKNIYFIIKIDECMRGNNKKPKTFKEYSTNKSPTMCELQKEAWPVRWHRG